MNVHFSASETAETEDITPWAPPDSALFLDAFGHGTDGRRPVVMALHPGAPFIGATGAGAKDEKGLQAVAHAYLTRIAARFQTRFEGQFPDRENNFLPPGWLNALNPDEGPSAFGWLKLVDENAKPEDLESQKDAASVVTSRITYREADQTIIMVAGDIFPSGFGLRIVMRVLDDGDGLVAINGLTAHLPHAPYSTSLGENQRAEIFFEFFKGYLADRSPRTDDETESPAFHEFRLRRTETQSANEITGFDFVLYGSRNPFRSVEKTLPQATIASMFRWTQNDPESAQLVAQWPVYSDAAKITVPVFQDDPVSDKDVQDPPPYIFGANRPTGLLEPARDNVEIPKVLETDDFIIRKCPDFVQQDKDDFPDDPREIDLMPDEVPNPRSDDQSAISAFFACAQFFKKITGFGLNTGHLFRRVNRPLHVHYRSGVRPGPGKDGRTVNARVEIRDFASSVLFPAAVGTAHMHLALANLTRWFRDVPEGAEFEARPAQPLGIANSRRWVHHEMGHVLIAAALGELEFRFVHSIGDSLAAILADPTSRISEADPDGAWADFRFQTFPWVFTTRRHDRSVLTGWSWSGTMHRNVLLTPEIELRRLKGYDSEQILSTTLFRLYRSLGGDTVADDGAPDVPARYRASLVVLYLLVRAVDSFAHPPLRAEELEGAMIEADLMLGTLASTVGDIWTGGQAHKAIRFAFEAQGLHPADPGRVNNRPGAPPPVDLYIKDRRSGVERTFAGEIDHGDGSYLPTSLHWAKDAGWAGELVNDRIEIGNRGTASAPSARLRGWVGCDTGAKIDWDPNLAFTDNIANPIPPGGTVHFNPATIDISALPIEKDVLLLLEVTAPEDRANTDPAAFLASQIAKGAAPPTSRSDVIDRVANDNNLGLFWLRPRQS